MEFDIHMDPEVESVQQVNIENRLDTDDVTKLMHFVKLLTAYMHEAVPGSTVIWYFFPTVQVCRKCFMSLLCLLY
jgi:hypothetical protein